MPNDKQKIIAEFSKYPVCGSTKRFAESVAQEQKEKGLIGEDFKCSIFKVGGPVIDPTKVAGMLVGTKVPAIFAFLDVCMDCGTVYAVRLERGEASLMGTTPQGPPFIPPGGGRG